MSEKPILFNTEMVRAILYGRKTQTRRLVKNIPLQEPYFEVVDGTPYACDGDGEFHPAVEFSPIQKGDVLYVRETWTEMPYGFAYRADGEEPDGWDSYDRWYPSIHMPKEAARIFLRVKGVRVERLQDMTPDDCANDGGFEPYAVKAVGVAPLFRELWNRTIDKNSMFRYGWNANPWVWVIEFERITL